MHIELISLPKPFLKRPDAQAPLGLLYLAAVLEKLGHSVAVHNFAAASADDAIGAVGPADWYGITVTSMELNDANAFARKLRDKYDGANVVVGGPGAQFHFEVYDVSSGDNAISSFWVGESESTIGTFFDNACKPGVYYGAPVQDLDSLPMPARHLLRHQGGGIFVGGRHLRGNSSAVIAASRGCPYDCAFCASPTMYRRRIRYRDPARVAEEIKHVRDTYGIQEFRFSDDEINPTRKRTLEMCRAIRGLGIVWRCSMRVRPIDDEMLGALWDAGCRELSFGCESFDNSVLRGLRKRATAVDNVYALNLAARHGFTARCLLMIRTPFQSAKTIARNMRAIRKLPKGNIAISCKVFVPLPGSAIWIDPRRHGVRIICRDIADYNYFVFGPEGRRDLPPTIAPIGRDLDEFIGESADFLDWLDGTGLMDRG